ncbi:CvpA family protein [Aestuariivirga litoralis]|uniref:CvpA family protein n=1 Tax=Aestuariivirga litoralis TaxID=2650924 RepID=UPI0018C7ED77|nr:CvpA family protein [Aestuariivirga litoralis]MBG1232136.1 CvpA family protein [Aestuariivirga litoralis]
MFQLLDLILLGIMLISGVLALARGFTREVLSLVAWGAAAAAAWYAIKQKQLIDMVAPHVDPTRPQIAMVIVGAAAFIVVLIIVSIIGVRVSDRVVDSSVGAVDRTVGFFYGLARGLVLVAICYMFYGWLLPVEKQEDWVRNAVSLPAIRWVSQTMLEHMPPDIAETLSNSSLIGNGPDGAGQTQTEKTDSPDKTDAQPADKNAGYTNGQQQGMDNLVKGTQQQDPAKKQ